MAKGAKTGGGSRKGVPNKATTKCREVISLIAEDLADDFKGWLFLTATGDEGRGIKPDPKGAADLYLKAIEYHIPKLARMTVAGDEEAPLQTVTKIKLADLE